MIGDQDDLFSRIERNLPPWFGKSLADAPQVGAQISGFAAAMAWLYGLLAYAALQTRIATATGGWLELIAGDFFGDRLPRFNGEGDANYRRRIRLEIFRLRATRRAYDLAVFDLTGNHPDIFEPWRPADCGGWGTVAMAYGRVGRYGSREAPGEIWIATPYPQGYGIPNRGGWGSGTGGYGSGNFSFVDDSELVGSGPTAADIVTAVDRVRAAGVTAYVKFTGI